MGTFFNLLIMISLLLVNAELVMANSLSDSKENVDLVNFYSSDNPDSPEDSPSDNPDKKPEKPTQKKIMPLGEIKGPTPPECHPRNLENRLTNQSLKAKNFTHIADEFFKKCEKYWNGPEKSGKMAMLDFIFTEYDTSKNKSIELVTLKMRDGSKVKAYMAMHDGFTRRPWVIAKCGVFCTATESTSVRNYLMSLFDQSPFNVIFLSNRTGVDYIFSNESLTLGGYLEAHDYYEIGRWLKEESPYKDTIDSLHALGISLAGSAAIFVEPLADAYGYDEDHRLYQSVMSICSVVNLQPTINDMYTNKMKRNLFTKLTWDELQQVKPALHEVDGLINRKKPDFSEFPNLMAEIILHYGAKWGRSPFTYRKTKEIESIEDLWELNQFSNLRKEIKAPLLVWGSKDDSIVNNELNIGTLPQSWVAQNSENLGVLNVNYGDHCAFATSYGYPVTSAILRSFILSHSKDFIEKRTLQIASFDFSSLKFESEKHLRQWWQAYPNIDYVTINIETHDARKLAWCSFVDIYENKSSACRKQTQVRVPIEVLKKFSVRIPKNNTEAEVLSRKLNGLLRVTSNGFPLEGTSLSPNQIEWYDYGL
jgi:hypothetical protein